MTTVLLTGATGTFGEAFLRQSEWTVRAYSRDEHKQHLLQETITGDVRWLLGDVRDRDRLRRAMEGCDTVVHAAALKHVTAGEHNPDEFVKTNVLGSLNVIEACHDTGVEKAVLLSSDKAVHPANLYGATKLCAEKLWLAANTIPPTKFSVVRYGNVKGSRGSLLEKERPVLRDSRATRFWMEPQQAVDLVLLALSEMQGGEVFVPKLEAGRVVDRVLENWAELAETGLLPGEKLHETLIAPEEVPRTYDCGDHYRIGKEPLRATGWVEESPRYYSETYEPIGTLVPPDFSYTSEAVGKA